MNVLYKAEVDKILTFKTQEKTRPGVAGAFNPSTQEVEVGGPLWVLAQPGLHGEF